jgi:hypothetical protein
MSATIKTNAAEGGALAHLNFRVRCETLGHGEGIFLVRSDDPHLTRVSFPNSRIVEPACLWILLPPSRRKRPFQLAEACFYERGFIHELE